MSLKTRLKSFVVNLLPGQRGGTFSALSLSGVSVSEETALNNTDVWACVRLLSETFASIPAITYRRTGRGKERATDHELYDLLHNAPNPEMNSFTFRETLMSHVLLWGNAYAQIDWEERTRVRALWPLLPNRMQVLRNPDTKQIIYRYTPSGGTGTVDLPAWRVLHIPGLGYDGLQGYSPIAMARNAIGLAQATEEAGSRLFKNGVLSTGLLETPKTLSESAQERLKVDFSEKYAGLKNLGRPIILEEGLSWKNMSINPADAQYLETRKYQRGAIASFFHVPPHMIGDLERSTNNNIEQQSLEFVVYTLRPWLVRWEQAIHNKLFDEDERKEYFVEFLVEGLLRGAPETRATFYKNLFYIGAMSPNDIREKENMNPIPDLNADKYFVQSNMIPMDMAGKVVSQGNPPA